MDDARMAYRAPNAEHEALAERLRSIKDRRPDQDPEVIAEVVRSVLSTIHGDLTPKGTTLLAEVEALGQTIASAKAEIAALRVDDIKQHDIPFATDELDAIVAHTASATHSSSSACVEPATTTCIGFGASHARSGAAAARWSPIATLSYFMLPVTCTVAGSTPRSSNRWRYALSCTQ